jgi:glycerol-3-phosphate acyltransferase PlsY
MNITTLIPVFILAYLIGSIPTSVWIGKSIHGIDIREHGSGNAGATNTIRVLGWKTGIPVLLVDVSKGWVAAMLPVFFHLALKDSPMITNLQILTGLAAIIGHIFPVYAGFRGGKGVATVFGFLLAINPAVTGVCIGVFLLVLLITGIVSVSSMSAGIAFPICTIFIFNTPSLVLKIFSILVGIALLVTHRQNIGRLFRGEEKKLFKKKLFQKKTPTTDSE